MPSEMQQENLQQPWKKWFDLLKPHRVIKHGGVVLNQNDGDDQNNGGSTSHGTVAIHPRRDVDFSKAKIR